MALTGEIRDATNQPGISKAPIHKIKTKRFNNTTAGNEREIGT